MTTSEGAHSAHSPVLWALVVGVLAVCGTALWVDAPTAVRVLAVVLLVLAGARAVDRARPSALAARSRPFDVAALLVLAAALVVIAPAGYLT
ncbi:DUF3017 domain-containing protein [Georgenia faecalis]|uniref:DUF3017 domain-containing protein n=1 Tax=Georgenia faecalis TaxID=2483799 RepID=A0ABV9D7M8_9MICO|nr:DUF3017 domain-containing protein [Georgenia faecalis]